MMRLQAPSELEPEVEVAKRCRCPLLTGGDDLPRVTDLEQICCNTLVRVWARACTINIADVFMQPQVNDALHPRDNTAVL